MPKYLGPIGIVVWDFGLWRRRVVANTRQQFFQQVLCQNSAANAQRPA